MLTETFNVGFNVIRPTWEIAAYESLWTRYSTTVQMAALFQRYRHALPSQVAQAEGFTIADVERIKHEAEQIMSFRKYSALFYGDFEYPTRLQDAQSPIEVLYYRGNLDLLSSRSVAVIGSRKATANGIARSRKVVRIIAENGFTVMSGLAEGIDTAAHQEAIAVGGKTIAVVGTALNCVYPSQNSALHDELVRCHLVVSQVPFVQYSRQDYQQNRKFFPERNKIMSALSLATVIVEASDVSGCLIQAQAAIAQGRKLFILKSCFEGGFRWTNRFLAQGAITIENGTELLEHLR
jgi:DNA processing protein